VSGLLRFGDDLTTPELTFGARIYFVDGRSELAAGEEADVWFETWTEIGFARAISSGMAFHYWYARGIGEGVVTSIDEIDA
jgi:hypothetical protein